ncbi:MAG: bifunctional nuclease family protein [Deltaproteobacteria bacterium]
MKRNQILSVFSALLLCSVMLFTGLWAEDGGDNPSEEQMYIQGIGFDAESRTPVVFLTDKERKKALPIWIGICEARSIGLSLSNEVAPRPLAYDMVAAMVRAMKGKVERVVIVDLRDKVFYAQIEISAGGAVSKIDARPSDAIALAARMRSPIYVNKSVLERASIQSEKAEKRGI